jgi:hypothetical protein
MSAPCFSLSYIIVNDLHVIKPFKLVATYPPVRTLAKRMKLGLIFHLASGQGTLIWLKFLSVSSILCIGRG